MEKRYDDRVIFSVKLLHASEELAKEMQASIATIRRRIADCEGRGLLAVQRLEKCGKLIFEIHWSAVDKANPNRQQSEVS